MYPNQCNASLVWSEDNPSVTTVVQGDQQLERLPGISVGFVNPFDGTPPQKIPRAHFFFLETLCPANPTFQPKEFLVPCLKRLLKGQEVVALPESGLTVEVVAFKDNQVPLDNPLEYTYLSTLFFVNFESGTLRGSWNSSRVFFGNFFVNFLLR